MANSVSNAISDIAGQLVKNYENQKICKESLVGYRVPSRDMIISLVKDLRNVTYPGYFGSENMAFVSKESFAGSNLAVIYEKLCRQVKIAIRYDSKSEEEATQAKAKAQQITDTFIKQIPAVQDMLFKDVQAEFNGDPAAKSYEDIILSYPGIFAVLVYRYAHELYKLDVPYIPRIMTEYAHSLTGIDINPGATIGEYFCIDHGTGIVIGETTTIGKGVKIYQGVTLGALSTRKGQDLAGVKRHPTIEDNVVIYANTTILGGETVIGENSVVAGNTFITKSIPANTKVASTMPELMIKTAEKM